MLRQINSAFSKFFVAERCKVSARRASEVIEKLADDGYIVFSQRLQRVDYYKLTEKGEKLAQASAVSKMSRTRADQIIAGLLKRVEEVNANAEYMYQILTVIVYGSYVRGELHLSDVDIAVDLEEKSDSTNKREWSNTRIQAARANGRTFANFTDVLFWPENEVMLHLKAHTRGLSIHRLDDFMDMTKDSNFAYKVLLGDAARIAEQIARGRSGFDGPFRREEKRVNRNV